MDPTPVTVVAILAVVTVFGMFFGKVRPFNIADVDANAAVGKWLVLRIRGKNAKPFALERLQSESVDDLP